MIKYLDFDQAAKIFSCQTAAIQLVCFKNRIAEKFNNHHLAQLEIIETNLAREWTDYFTFPKKNLKEPLASNLNKMSYKLDRWDVVRIIRVLFNEMILYRV